MTLRLLALSVLALAVVGCSDDDTTTNDPYPSSITIEVQPSWVDAVWTLTGPGSFVRTGSGGAAFTDLERGTYTVEWGEQQCTLTPPTTEYDLAAGESKTLVGTYGTSPAPALVSLGPSGADRVVAALDWAFECLHYEVYEAQIHPDYVFRVDPSDVNIVGQAEFSRVEDLESMYRMFSGEFGQEPVLDASGNPTGQFQVVPPVQAIQVSFTPASGSEWMSLTDGEFAGAWRRIFDVDMTVTHSGGTRIDQIRGKQIFYVVAATVDIEGVATEVWQLRAWEDQGINSGAGLDPVGSVPTEGASMSQLKATY